MGVAVAQPISPELALVCPELRERALALLPALDADALFAIAARPVTARIEVPRPEVRAPRQLVLVEEKPRAPLPVALAAYIAEALVLGAARGATLTAVIAALAFVLAR